MMRHSEVETGTMEHGSCFATHICSRGDWSVLTLVRKRSLHVTEYQQLNRDDMKQRYVGVRDVMSGLKILK